MLPNLIVIICHIWIDFCHFIIFRKYYIFEGPTLGYTTDPPTLSNILDTKKKYIWVLHIISCLPGFCIFGFSSSVGQQRWQTLYSVAFLNPVNRTPHPPPRTGRSHFRPSRQIDTRRSPPLGRRTAYCPSSIALERIKKKKWFTTKYYVFLPKLRHRLDDER